MRLRERLVRFWLRLRGLVAAINPPPSAAPATKLTGVPVFPLPHPDYEVSLNWDSDQEVAPDQPRRRYVVGWIQKKRKPGNDPGDDEDGYDGSCPEQRLYTDKLSQAMSRGPTTATMKLKKGTYQKTHTCAYTDNPFQTISNDGICSQSTSERSQRIS